MIADIPAAVYGARDRPKLPVPQGDVAITAGMFGLALATVLWGSLASRIVAPLVFVVVSATLILTWWFNRDDAGDVPFWLAGLVMLGFGWAMFKSGRQDWLNLELGAETVA